MEEEEKIPKQKPHTSFNRRLPIAKNPEGNMTTAKKNVKNFILQGGNMTKGITVLFKIWVRCYRTILEDEKNIAQSTFVEFICEIKLLKLEVIGLKVELQ